MSMKSFVFGTLLRSCSLIAVAVTPVFAGEGIPLATRFYPVPGGIDMQDDCHNFIESHVSQNRAGGLSGNIVVGYEGVCEGMTPNQIWTLEGSSAAQEDYCGRVSWTVIMHKDPTRSGVDWGRSEVEATIVDLSQSSCEHVYRGQYRIELNGTTSKFDRFYSAE
jgi:hypothetical protein